MGLRLNLSRGFFSSGEHGEGYRCFGGSCVASVCVCALPQLCDSEAEDK